MANPMEIFQQLEYIPDEQLVEYINDPNSQIPKYAALDEIQKRTNTRKSIDASGPKPEITVADEVVKEFVATSPGLTGAMTQTPGGNLSTPSAESNMAPPLGLGGGMPMQTAAAGGLTSYANGGRTGYKTGGIPFVMPAGYTFATLGIELGIRDFDANGNPKNKAQFEDEVKEAFISVNQPAVASPDLTNTGIGSLTIPPQLLNQANSLGIDTANMSSDQIMQVIADQNVPNVDSSGLPLNSGLPTSANISSAPPPQTIPQDTTNTAAQDVLNLLPDINMGSIPDIQYQAVDIPESYLTPTPGLTDAVKNFKLPELDLETPSDIDRQNELNVHALGTMAKAFGTAKNLGEAGAALGEGALGLSQIKKAQRDAANKVIQAQRNSALQNFQVDNTIAELEAGVRKEQFSKDKAITEIKTANSIGELEAALNLTKYRNELKGAEYLMAKNLVNMEIVKDQIAATNNKTAGNLYASISNELLGMDIADFDLFDEDTGKPNAKGERYIMLSNNLNALLKQLYASQGIVLDESKPYPGM